MKSMRSDFLTISPSSAQTPSVQPNKKNPFNTLDRSPIRPNVKSLREMEYKDVKRFQIYKHYSGLHDFSAQDISSNTLEER